VRGRCRAAKSRKNRRIVTDAAHGIVSAISKREGPPPGMVPRREKLHASSRSSFRDEGEWSCRRSAGTHPMTVVGRGDCGS